MVIPAYGRVEPLKYTLKSTAKAVREAGGGEILVVDDGSEPPLEEQLRGFEAGHPVKYLRQRNQGSIVARMTGLAAAQGKYVLFLDSDDLIHPEKIRKQTEAMERSGAEVSYSNMAEARLGGNYEVASFTEGTKVQATEDSVELFGRVQPAPHAPIYRREYLQKALAKPVVGQNRGYDPSGDIWLYRNLILHPAKVEKVEGGFTATGPHEEQRYSLCWEKLGAASLLIEEEFFRNCPKTEETEKARRVLGEVEFVSWRTLPYDLDANFRKRALQIWKQGPKGSIEKLGGKGFRLLAKMLGPVAAGWILRRLQRPSYEACRSLPAGKEIRGLLSPDLSASTSKMRKIKTAWALAAKGKWREFGDHLLIHLRRAKIRKMKGEAFPYRLKGRGFFCVPGLVDSEDLYLHRKFDETEIRILEAWLSPGDTVADLGANIGLYAFTAANRVGPGGWVLAIEAAPRLAEKLRAGKKLQPRACLQIENIAVGDKDRKAAFVVHAPERHSNQQSLLSGQGHQPNESQIVEVSMERLETVAQRHPRLEKPDLIKMDIEGAEGMALQGCPPGWFDLNGPLWILEINPAALEQFGATPQEITERFPHESHERWLLPKYTREGKEEGAPRRLLENEKYLDARFYNLIAVPLGVARKDAARKGLEILKRLEDKK